MISIENAIQAVLDNSSHNSKSINLPILKAVNSTLFSDVPSPINMPPFRQSAMDGYALNLYEGLSYSLIGEVKAGDSHHIELIKGEAIRIFTGAAVPDSANAVIMQEKVAVNNNTIVIETTLPINHNIRCIGEQVKQGAIALKKGTKLTPAAIGYLSSLGISEVEVHKKPSIDLITTGNELIEAEEPLVYGKIYESNSKMLQTALVSLGFEDVSIHKIDDNYNDTLSKIKNVLKTSDMIIITGGISVGDYDFVGRALKELEVDEIFYKVNQKPGKPLYFGKNNHTLIFALPGNPAAALSCFYIYVNTALQKMTGLQEVSLPKIMAKSNSDFLKSGDRPQFLKAYYHNGRVTVLEGQSSAMLQTFAVSNALVIMKEDVLKINVNDVVEVVLLPF